MYQVAKCTLHYSGHLHMPYSEYNEHYKVSKTGQKEHTIYIYIYTYIFHFSQYSIPCLQSRCLGPHLPLFLWQHCSQALSPTALLGRCTVSHQLPPHVHPVLTVPTVPHYPSMHKTLSCILPPTPLWCSYQVTMFSIQISQSPM